MKTKHWVLLLLGFTSVYAIAQSRIYEVNGNVGIRNQNKKLAGKAAKTWLMSSIVLITSSFIRAIFQSLKTNHNQNFNQ